MAKIIYERINTALRNLLIPFYYSNIGCKIFDIIERLIGFKIEKWRIYKKIGYYPDLKNPRSFNEKVLWKKIYDRNPLLPIVSDKYSVRDYLKKVLGEEEVKKILVPLYYVTDNPDTIPFNNLQKEYIIKPNNTSGKVIICENVENKKRYRIIENYNSYTLFDNNQTRFEIKKICKKWLLFLHGFDKHEWAYKNIKRKIIIEKLLRDNNRKIPADYKFFMFHGKCHLILVFHDRFDDPNVARYTPDWEYLNIRQVGKKQADCENKPKNLSKMIELAELLAIPFDFIRVDLYIVDDCIYFSELANYPTSARTCFNPSSFDFELGSKWTIFPGYWRMNSKIKY